MSENSNALMKPADAAIYLNCSVAVLNTWRCTGKQKIPYVKWGRHIRFRKQDLDSWIESQAVNQTNSSTKGE